MKAIVLLADAAQTDPNGKVHALGLGWSSVSVIPTPPHALVVLIDVGWDETNKKFPFHAELVDGDGHQVMTQTELGEQPLQMDGVLEAGRPPGHPPGSPVRIAFSVGFGPLNLSAGQRYEWRVSIDGDHDENWSAGFNVVVPVPGPGQA